LYLIYAYDYFNYSPILSVYFPFFFSSRKIAGENSADSVIKIKRKSQFWFCSVAFVFVALNLISLCETTNKLFKSYQGQLAFYADFRTNCCSVRAFGSYGSWGFDGT